MLACALAYYARMARALPPSGDAYPLVDPYSGDRVLGVLAAGRGLILNCQLRDLGVTRPIPFVRERSTAMRLVDTFRSEAAALTSMAALRAADIKNNPFNVAASLGGGSNGSQYMTFVEHSSAGIASSGIGAMPPFAAINTNVGYSALPAGAAVDGTNTSNLLGWLTNPRAGNTTYIRAFACMNWDTAQNAWSAQTMVADLLWQAKTSVTVTTAQTVTSSLTRYTSGLGVLAMAFVDEPGDISMTPSPGSLTIGYTNPAGVASRSSVNETDAAGGACGSWCQTSGGFNTNNWPWYVLQAGDTGMKSIETYTSNATDTAALGGFMGLHMYKPLIFLPGVSDFLVLDEYDFTTMPELFYPLATTGGGALGCITVYQMNTGSNLSGIRGQIRTCEG